jgi:hypothetical protein
MSKVLDLKVFKPEDRVFRLLDEEGREVKSVNVSRVPTDAVISILDNMDVLIEMQKGNINKKAFNMLLDVAVDTCKANDEDVTREYLLEQLDIFGVVELIMFVIEPVMARLREGDKGSKKPEAT